MIVRRRIVLRSLTTTGKEIRFTLAAKGKNISLRTISRRLIIDFRLLPYKPPSNPQLTASMTNMNFHQTIIRIGQSKSVSGTFFSNWACALPFHCSHIDVLFQCFSVICLIEREGCCVRNNSKLRKVQRTNVQLGEIWPNI